MFFFTNKFLFNLLFITKTFFLVCVHIKYSSPLVKLETLSNSNSNYEGYLGKFIFGEKHKFSGNVPLFMFYFD